MFARWLNARAPCLLVLTGSIGWSEVTFRSAGSCVTIVLRVLFARVGLYDTRFRMGADHEFFLRAIVVRGAGVLMVGAVLIGVS